MSGLIPVDPRINNEAKLALASLLGSTMAQLKEIDRSIVGSSSNIQSKLDVNGILGAIKSQPVHQASPPPQHVAPPQLEFIPTPVPVQNVPSPEIPSAEDPNQLVFDFNKPITPDTINSKLDGIISKLDRIIELLKP